jgi:methyl-accepting chemotaxis protein
MRFNNLTIGRRIALGFTLVFVILGVVSGIAWITLGASGTQLQRFSSSTKETQHAFELTGEMLALKLGVNSFLANPTPEALADYTRTKKLLEDELKAAVVATANGERQTLLGNAQGLLADYDKAFGAVVEHTNALNALVQNNLQSAGKQIDVGFQSILSKARSNGDLNVSFRVSNALKAYFECSSLINSFLLTSRAEQATGARDSIKIVNDTLAKLQKDYAETVKMDESMKDPAQETAMREVEAATANYVKTLEDVIATKQERDLLVTEKLNVLAPKFTSSLALIQDSVNTYQENLSLEIKQAQQRDERRVLSVTIGAVVLGLVIAWIIIRSIVRPIQKIATSLESDSQLTLTAARQVASVSESIASGASTQAASLEESSASLHELTSMTQQNSQGAQDAKNLAAEARATADAGTADMLAMSQAMDAIQQSSNEVSKIIKTIDEIAFQTNLLALNAAVEAARAGQAGAGFAVVADEVRSLAQRSAQAARETSDKIAAALDKSRLGAQISGKVTSSLGAIVEKIRQLDERMGQITTASVEQTHGLQQISTAVTSMDETTQSNAALAEEAASSAAQLQAQATEVQAAVAQLMVMVRGARTAPVESVSTKVITPTLPTKKSSDKDFMVKFTGVSSPATGN